MSKAKKEVKAEVPQPDNSMGAIPADELAADAAAHVIGESIQEPDMEPTPEQLAAAKLADEEAELARRIASRPTVGRTLLYTLSHSDAADIDSLSRSGRCAEHTPAKEGDVYPYVITRIEHDAPYVSGRVLLDGVGVYHAVLRQEGRTRGVGQPGCFHWPKLD